MLVNEVEGTNQLVESCRIHLLSELFITELECFAYFNHYVTFPFLNCTEVSSQIQLLQILPKLYSDLTDGKETLAKLCCFNSWNVISYFDQQSIRKNFKDMCTSAASAVKLQCGREYGFGDDKARATNLSLLNDSDLEGLPTNNLIAERDLSRFDRKANVAKSRNRRFNAKNIRNDMVLYKSKKEIKLDKLSKKLLIVLSNRKTNWNTLQQEKLKSLRRN